MAAFTKFYDFVGDLAHGVHNLGSDTLEIALTSVAPAQTDGQLSDLTQISYSYLTADRTLTVSLSAETGGTYKLVVADKLIEASGGTAASFQYVVIFNQSATNDELIGFYNYGSSVTLNDGDTFTIDFDGTNGVLQIT